MVKVLITEPVHEEALKKLRDFFGQKNVVFTPIEEINKGKGLVKTLKEINPDVLIVRSNTKVNKEAIDAASNLKYIGRPGLGLDNIDFEHAKQKGVKVENTREAEAIFNSVAELVIALALSLYRKIPLFNSSIKEGLWLKRQIKTGLLHTLNGKTIGIIGLGKIGKKVAKLALSFGMKVQYYDIYRNLEFEKVNSISFVELKPEDKVEGLKLPKKILQTSDIITIHVPLTKGTRNLLGEKEISMLKKGAIVINTSRGEVVNEEALTKALLNNKISGAGLDVYSYEPPFKGPPHLKILTSLPNVVCTHHIGAKTEEAQKQAGLVMAEKIINFFKRERQGRMK